MKARNIRKFLAFFCAVMYRYRYVLLLSMKETHRVPVYELPKIADEGRPLKITGLKNKKSVKTPNFDRNEPKDVVFRNYLNA